MLYIFLNNFEQKILRINLLKSYSKRLYFNILHATRIRSLCSLNLCQVFRILLFKLLIIISHSKIKSHTPITFRIYSKYVYSTFTFNYVMKLSMISIFLLLSLQLTSRKKTKQNINNNNNNNKNNT